MKQSIIFQIIPSLISLDVSDYSGCFKNILADPIEREDFAFRLSVHCPKIVTFVVPDIDGVRFVLDYINKKDVGMDDEDGSNLSPKERGRNVGIKSLQVFTLKTQTYSLVQLFQLIQRVTFVSPSFESLEFGPMKGELPPGGNSLNQIESSWDTIGKSIKRFKLTNYDDLRPRGGNDLEQLIISKLVGMESITLEVVSKDDMDLITIRNPRLITLETDYMMSGFNYLQRLKQLKVLKIKELQNSLSSPIH